MTDNHSKRPLVPALALAVSVLATACSGNTTVTEESATPTTTQADPTRSPTIADGRFDLDTVVAEFVGDADGGAAVLIVRNGNTSAAAAGVASSSGDLLEPGTPLRVGSVSKPFVAVMVLQLVDEGVVDLDATLSTYLPATPLGEDVTIRALLSHQSGLPNYTDQPRFFVDVLADRAHTYTPSEVLGYVADVPAEDAGSFSYSNTNYVLLGQLIEHIDQTTLNDALQTRISEPLGLEDTAFVGSGVPTPLNLAGGWSRGVLTGERMASYESVASSAWSAGALVSTTGNLGTFLTALFGGDLITSASLAQMTDTGPSGYGLGVYEAYLGSDSPGYAHNGSIPGYSSTMAIDPVSGDVIVILTNNDALIADELAPLILGAW